MEWFNGYVEITLNDGTARKVFDVNVAKAQKEIDFWGDMVKEALYFPYPLSMK